MNEQKLIQKYIIVRMWTRLDSPRWVGALHSVIEDGEILYIQPDGSFSDTPHIFSSLTSLLQTISTSWKGICIKPFGDQFLVDKSGTSLYLDQNGNECDGLAPMSLEETIRVTKKYLSSKSSEPMECSKVKELCPVSHRDYMQLSNAIDEHSKHLVQAKGEEYSIEGDFLAMENRLAGMLGESPELVSLVMAGKHITSLGIILDKNEPEKIKLEKWDERIRDAINLLKITSAFIHAKQNDFSLHLGKEEKNDR